MPGLRIGIDVGGTFTHGVVLRPPGEVLTTARTATTHTGEHGVADGVRAVLADLLRDLDERGVARNQVELVAHSTTQATNALLEGDVAPVTRIVIVPPGEMFLAKSALRGLRLNLGGGHSLPLTTHYVPWETLEDAAVLPDVAAGEPVAVIQPLAGGHANRERPVAEHYLGLGHPVVCASEITQVLGLAARARTAAVNASMLPTMLKTAEFTERAVRELLPEVPLQVVRSDGGAMSIDEMRRQPILSLLSGPAAGASAALDLSGLSEVVFIEVGGTSTDITLIKEGRVRHRYATVGGQRLMVPALDLRTVAVGGGSMRRMTEPVCGPRSAHIAGYPYAFQQFAKGLKAEQTAVLDPRFDSDDEMLPRWKHENSNKAHIAALCDLISGSGAGAAAITLTDLWLMQQLDEDQEAAFAFLGGSPGLNTIEQFNRLRTMYDADEIIKNSIKPVITAVQDLAVAHKVNLTQLTLIGGGGGAPVITSEVGKSLNMPTRIIDNYEVISAIGAALAVTCASQSRTVAEPTGADIAELTQEVERRLAAQGAHRVATDYEYDAHRQVLTVTGRGSRAYEQDSSAKDTQTLENEARELLGSPVERVWDSPTALLWVGVKRRRSQPACAQTRLGRCLWLGSIREWFDASPGHLDEVLGEIVRMRTAYTDGGPALPGLALICDGRFIPLDALSSHELISEVLRWESLPADAAGCFVIRA